MSEASSKPPESLAYRIVTRSISVAIVMTVAAGLVLVSVTVYERISAPYQHDAALQLSWLKACMTAHAGIDTSRLERITAGPDVDKYCEAFAEQNSRVAKP